MRRIVVPLGGVVAVIAGYLLAWPIPIDPVAWTPPPNPGFTGRFAPNDALARVELLLEGVGTGPEDVARGPDGLLSPAPSNARPSGRPPVFANSSTALGRSGGKRTIRP